MRTFSIFGVCAINFVIGCRYVWLLRQGRIRPALAMWVFFTIATVGSLATYLAEGDYGLLDNILNTADLFLVSTVALAIARYGDRSTRFTRFDFGCLAAVALILVAWGLSRQHVAAHLAIQAILVIAYIPVVHRLWEAERNTESYVMWIGLMIAPLIGLLSSRGTLATVYAIRSSVCPALLLLLMLRTTVRTRSRPSFDAPESGANPVPLCPDTDSPASDGSS